MQGKNNTLQIALETMLTNGEFDRIIKYAKFGERGYLKKLKKTLTKVMDSHEDGLKSIPTIVLVNVIDSASLWKDIFYYTVYRYNGLDEEDVEE